MEQPSLSWYAMRVTYSREIPFKEYLESQHIECFIPMHYALAGRGPKKKKQLVPIVHNLIFVRTTKPAIDQIKTLQSERYPIRYIMRKTTAGERIPITVPDNQMKSFIAVCGTYDEQLSYLDISRTTNFNIGDRVRVTDGIFAGCEGKLVKIRGSKYQRVIVLIQDVMAVMTAKIHPSLIEKIE